VRDDYLRRLGAALPRWSLEITLESHLERIRHRNRRFDCGNDAIEHTLREALESGAGRVDLFFMVGLPGQTYEDAVGCADYCRSLLETFRGDRRLAFFVAPLAPFLDPGSAAFENPEQFGYRVRFRTLEEHRVALTAPSWKEMLNYETEWMTRGQIVAATYEAMRRLAQVKREWNLLDEEAHARTVGLINASEEAIAALESGKSVGAASAKWTERSASRGPNPFFQKRELYWPIGSRRFASLFSLAGVAAELAVREARLFATRRLPRYLAGRRPASS